MFARVSALGVFLELHQEVDQLGLEVAAEVDLLRAFVILIAFAGFDAAHRHLATLAALFPTTLHGHGLARFHRRDRTPLVVFELFENVGDGHGDFVEGEGRFGGILHDGVLNLEGVQQAERAAHRLLALARPHDGVDAVQAGPHEVLDEGIAKGHLAHVRPLRKLLLLHAQHRPADTAVVALHARVHP